MVLNRKVLLSLFFILFFSQYFFPVFSMAAGMEGYVTSTECRKCHEEIYNQWKKTPHARMLRNALKDPGAIEATNFGPD
ncbi:MAG TPA: hypothetical protein ENH32_07815, partial [Proteobacteria bacterium]|nr:hypothetical protein [Pseudomonadota bacterium]